MKEIFSENSHIESQWVNDSGDEAANEEENSEKKTKIKSLEFINRLKLYCHYQLLLK